MSFLKLVLLLVFFLLCSSSKAQQRRSNITQGASLTPNQISSWVSNSGLYAFGFYPQGDGYSVGVFLSGISDRTVVWTFNRDSPPVAANATLSFSSEGRLVLRSTRGTENIGDNSRSASWASMLDSGNFALFTSGGNIIWQSFDSPTDTLLPSQRLLPGSQLVSSSSKSVQSSGIFYLAMQTDGNLVQYPVKIPNTPWDRAWYAYYASGTDGNGNNVTLVFDGDSTSLFLVNSTGVNIRNISDSREKRRGAAYLMRLDADGIFRLYSHPAAESEGWSIEWESSRDKCSPKGLCGLNGFCIQNDQKADCACLPGFDFVQRGNWTSGCVRNIVAENSCGSEKRYYSMEEVPNTSWEDNEYATVEVDDKDGCVRVCLDDCNCEAAFFQNRQCQKQRLPLRFGRRSNGDSNVALVKVYTSNAPDRGSSLPGKKDDRKILILSVVLISFGFLMMLVSVAVILGKNRIRAYKRIEHDLVGEEAVALTSFTFQELERMTGGFGEEIGRGSFGTVYKGRMMISGGSAAKEVAVKRLEKSLGEDGGEREFRNEMRAIGKTHHKNLVRLLGYCHEGPNRALVYEYMSNGSLAETLFRPENRPSFEERLEISCGVARGVLYLHEECEGQIIHCDIKPQNILMDEQRRAKISDFGLAKLLKPDQTRTFTGIRGTRGYVAPEWHRKQPITTKADVYSFGVVLLEIACCRKNVSWELPEAEAVLEEWAYECFAKDELMRLVESGEEEETMMSTVDKKQLERMVKVALWCIQEEPSLRPSMKKVVLMLEGTVDIPIPPSPQFFY